MSLDVVLSLPVVSDLRSFFCRHNLPQASFDLCVEALRTRYSGHQIHLLHFQGACSLTITVKPRSRPFNSHTSSIVQIRPIAFAVNPDILSAARQVYGTFVPVLLHVDSSIPGLQLVETDLAHGTPWSAQLSQGPLTAPDDEHRLATLLRGLAAFFAAAWTRAQPHPPAGTRRSSPSSAPGLAGKVGPTLSTRLAALAAHLPSRPLRARANAVRAAVVDARALVRLPRVLTHGDPLPANFLARPSDGALTAVVDWAEAEHLPFGLGLHGLDHFLGYRAPERGREPEPERRWRWHYYAAAPRLRRWFWDCLCAAAPALREPGVGAVLRVARDAGVLLWHGFAWDGGRIDRVVGADDWEEMEYLRAFLGMEAAECGNAAMMAARI